MPDMAALMAELKSSAPMAVDSAAGGCPCAAGCDAGLRCGGRASAAASPVRSRSLESRSATSCKKRWAYVQHNNP